MKRAISALILFTVSAFAQAGLNDVEGYYAACQMYFDGGDYEMALSCAEHGIELVPESSQMWYMKSVSLERLGRYDEAIAGYEHTLTLDPEHVFTLDNLGNLYVAAGKIVKAFECYEKSMAIDDKNPILYNNYGNLLRL
ncbi:MAG: tetratricopeptide repeat protein, partial [Candidatus Dadabacteria bacterium]|nr:tetratricopeptide repeat protein [Candidatus Dadabacteria bacterium]